MALLWLSDEVTPAEDVEFQRGAPLRDDVRVWQAIRASSRDRQPVTGCDVTIANFRDEVTVAKRK